MPDPAIPTIDAALAAYESGTCTPSDVAKFNYHAPTYVRELVEEVKRLGADNGRLRTANDNLAFNCRTYERERDEAVTSNESAVEALVEMRAERDALRQRVREMDGVGT